MRFPAAALTLACVLMARPGTAHAKGGGHGGGGHSSGHSAGGHHSAGHTSSSHASSRSGTSSPHRSENNATARGRTHIGPPGPDLAVPRPAPLPTVPVGGGLSPLMSPLPSYPLFGLYGGMGISSYAGAPIVYADVTGGLRLDVEPGYAELIVDGYYAGIVDDFGGRFHHLNLAPGPHHVEILAPGYQALEFDLLIQSHHTTRFTATLAPSVP